MTKNSEADLLDTLSDREREVLYLSVQDKTSTEIAKQLVVSRRTVEAQRASLFRKLGIHSQRELIMYATKKGLLAPDNTI
jgi:DNA-binding CsgD family transcriptional regulator